MKFFDNLKAERLIKEIRSKGNPQHPQAQHALDKLGDLGSVAIVKILETLPSASKQEIEAYVPVLAKLANGETFQILADSIASADLRTKSAICSALSISRNYPTELLLKQLNRAGAAKASIIEIISAQKNRFGIRDLLNQAYKQKPADQAMLFRIISEIATDKSILELLSRIDGKDPVVRMYLVDILSRFDQPEVTHALHKLLKDSNKQIKQSVLNALLRTSAPLEIEPICELLLDPDLETQNKAIELIIRAGDPNTMRYLIPALKDENEYARRGAVEVLNTLGTAKDIKQLLNIIRDQDWWVRSRAADALGKIGGPKVIEAVLQLLSDEDQEVRRTAIEILHQTKDERAVTFLIKATYDADWWAAERAVDALGEIGNTKALPRLIELAANSKQEVLPAVARALGKISDPSSLETVIELLKSGDKVTKIDSLTALALITDSLTANSTKSLIQKVIQDTVDEGIIEAARKALETIEQKLGATTANPAEQNTQFANQTLLSDRVDLKTVVNTAESLSSSQKLEINTLKPGDVIDERYKFIKKIGKGAFGTVLLVQDAVVQENLVLKFLNQNISQDEEAMKRFVHELRYSRKITHKNVIRIYDFVYMRGLYAISMEYFPSHPLNKEIIDEQPLPIQKAVQFGCDIAAAMVSAHGAGIIHRDLKPANILINDAGELKVVDFGVAAAHKENDTQLTKTGFVIGSPKYMAPEQIMGKTIDAQSDIYSLGIILYEMLTGTPPYAKGEHMSVMYQHVKGQAINPTELNPTIPEALSTLVMKAIKVDKANRFQSMQELHVALTEFL